MMSAPAAPPTAPEGLRRLQRRTLVVLVVAQAFGGAGLAAGLAVGALLARDLLGGEALSGLPSALQVIGAALAAVPLSRLMGRLGRRPGLVSGYLLGAVGAAVAVAAAEVRSFPLLLIGSVLFGVGNASNLLSRYAAADLALPAGRARAISTVLLATTLGAVAGPNLVDPMGGAARALELPTLAGPFVLAVAAYGVAAVVLFVALRPDPLVAAGGLRSDHRREATTPARPLGVALRDGRAPLALAAMAVTQLVMVSVMTMTPVHLEHHGHGLSVVGVVISVHIAGMYLPSPVTGLFCDRVGRVPTIGVGGGLLVAAGALAAVAPPGSTFLLTSALLLLGIGWNFGLIGSSTLLTDSVAVADRTRVQGVSDLLMGSAGAAGGVLSGVVLAVGGFAMLGVLGAAIAAPLVLTAVRLRGAPVLDGATSR